LYAGKTVEEQRRKNITSAKVTKISSSSRVLWFIIIISNIRTPPTLNFIIEVEILINIIKKRFNIPMAIYIIMITVLSVTLSTNFMQGNKKKKITKKRIYKRDQIASRILIVVVTACTTRNKMA